MSPEPEGLKAHRGSPEPEGLKAHRGWPEPQAAPPLTLAALEAAIRASWGRDTSDDPDEWTPDWSSRGQCGVTAIVVRDLLGGEILIAPVIGSHQEGEHHGWNRLASGLELDLTADQFLAGETLGTPVVGEPYGHDRAAILAARVRARLAGGA